MNTPNLENINVRAPYKVRRELTNNYSFYFETDYGLKYTISFMLEYSFVQSGAYQFCINVEGDGRSPGDKKLRQTIFTIIEEFFEVNGSEAMLYLCETGDEKEGLRNRLFIHWFNIYEYRDRYIIRTAEGKLDGVKNFTALFSRKDNPRLEELLAEFDETISILFDPPEESA